MGIDKRGNVIAGAGLGSPLRNAGVPSAGTAEVQTITIGGTPTAGTFKLHLDGHSTAAITWSATNATLIANIDAALEALPNIGTGGVVVAAGTLTDGIGTITVTFAAKKVQSLMTYTNNLTGTSPTIAIAETTPGVTSTFHGAPKGAQVIDTANGVAYINTGTATVPVWTKTGTQS